VARPFAYGADPFRAGWHRGADFRAGPGAIVRAACSGRVAWAGRDVVTVRCGAFRVTHLPLARVRVPRGARVRAGARIGTLARSRDHAGLHLGVRRASDRFGYVDPVPLLAAPPRPVPAAPPRIVWPRPAPPRFDAPPRSEVRVLAPWPAWLGLAVLLAGAVGGGVRLGVRRRRATVAALARR
jgi:Peptidase family M23